MSIRPLISVLMNCYNSDKYLRESIESVLNQSYSNWELIFWDNCSTDESANIVKAYVDKRIRYFRGREFVSLGEARNLAINKVAGEYLAILDCDDVWLPSKLEKQVAIFLREKDVAAVYSNYLKLDEKGGYEQNLLNNRLIRRGRTFENIFLHKLTIPWPTVMFRTSVVIEVGMFSHYKQVEDFDILLKIAVKGLFFYIDENLAIYRIHTNQLSVDYDLTLKEILVVYDYWYTRWTNNSKHKLKNYYLLIRGRSKIYHITGLRAIIQNEKASKYFISSSYFLPTPRSILLLIISLIPFFKKMARRYYFEKE